MPDEFAKSNGQRLETLEVSPNGSDAHSDQDHGPVDRKRSANRMRLLWNRRRFIVRWTLAGVAVSLAVSLCIPNQYESTVRLMPPDQVSSGMAALAASAVGGNSSGFGAIGSELLGFRSTSALFVELLQGRTVQEDVINKFALRKLYSDRYMEDARNDLRMNTIVSEDRRSGIVTIRTTDKDPRRAAAMAGEYVEELNRLVTTVNTSSAHRERIFLEGRLEQVKKDLEMAENNFSQFASKNAAIDIPAQGKAMIEAAAGMEGELVAAETELESLKELYADGNVRVRSMQARVNELQRQLRKLGGKPSDGSAASVTPKDGSEYPSIRSLPLLGVSYADLYRNTKVQEAIFEALTRQYELAKVQEAKETPSVKIVDAPDVPEKKSFPHRAQITLFGGLSVFLFSFIWIFARASWDDRDPQDPQKVLSLEVYRTFREGLRLASRNGAVVVAPGNGTAAEAHDALRDSNRGNGR